MIKTGNFYRVKRYFAQEKNIPITFEATVLNQTDKAVYLYGHGTTDPTGRCACCGRTLTHPGSILIGVGPECLKNWSARDVRMDNMSKADEAYLKQLVFEQVIDCWLPKTAVKAGEGPVEIEVPSDHPMLKRTNGKSQKAQDKTAVAIRFADSGKLGVKMTFDFDRTPSSFTLINEIKTIPGRRYHKEGPHWTAPASVPALQKIKELGFIMDQELEAFLEKADKVVNTKKLKPISIPGLQQALYPFQELGVAFIEEVGGRAILADEMGLGKTAQALAWTALHPKRRPVVIVCPSFLKLNWMMEILKWLGPGPQVQILYGKNPDMPLYGEYIIANYDILPNKQEKDEKDKRKSKEIDHTGWVDFLRDINPQVVLIDEFHYCKNSKALRSKAVAKLVKRAPYVVAMSGTPIVNRPMEGFNTLKMIDVNRMVVTDFWTYAHRYCGAKHNGFGWDFSGATNTEELHQKLIGRLMIRRLKADVLTELPDKQYSTVLLDLDNAKEYKKAEKDFYSYLRESIKDEKEADKKIEKATHAQHLVKVEVLKQLAAKGKLPFAIEWIQDFLDTSDSKLVVFATHKAVLDAVEQAFPPEASVRIDGSVPSAKRQERVEAFQKDAKVRLFIGNIQAAGVGLTLTAASDVVFLELPWTPGELVQAEDRCHRIGQKNAVNIYYLMASGSIDHRIALLLEQKRAVLAAVLDGKSNEDIGSIFSKLLEELQDDLNYFKD